MITRSGSAQKNKEKVTSRTDALGLGDELVEFADKILEDEF